MIKLRTATFVMLVVIAGGASAQREPDTLGKIEAATTWTFDGRLLDMHRADGERALTAARSVD